MTKKTFGILGFGAMAEALISGALASSFLEAKELIASVGSAERCAIVEKRWNFPCLRDSSLIAQCPKILLAVKPQKTEELLNSIQKHITPDTLLISVCAGKSSGSLDKYLGYSGRIIRAMPNTPALVGKGITALCMGPRATDADLEWSKAFFCSVGRVVEIQEEHMDVVTALSGSGPAYFFYLVEAMTEAGVRAGLTEELSLELSKATAEGAAKLLNTSKKSPEELRKQVTSPKGVTEKVLNFLTDNDVKEHIIQAIHAGIVRSKELGTGNR